MKKIDLGQMITIFANLGVIAGIVFLAIGVRQNNMFMLSEARMARLELRKEGNDVLIESPQLNSAFLRFMGGEELSRVDQTLVNRYFVNTFWNFNAIFEEYESGLLPEYQLQPDAVREIITSPSVRPIWERTRGRLNPDFVRWAEALESP